MGRLHDLAARLHHYAFVVRDHEVNRQFFEDVLGLPMVATWCERLFNSEGQSEVATCHTFFGLADGSLLASFQFADEDMYELSKAVYPQIGRYQHIALKVDRKTFDEIDSRLAGARAPRRRAGNG